MRFTDFLKSTVFLMAAEATALGAVSVVSAATRNHTTALIESVAFWVLAGLAGAIAGRGKRATAGIDSLLAEARNESALPELQPSSVLINRLWPLGVLALLTAVPALLYAQIPAIGAAFLIFSALAWRKQEKAVSAIEERDGARFYVIPGSPFRRPELVRTPGMRRLTSVNGGPA